MLVYLFIFFCNYFIMSEEIDYENFYYMCGQHNICIKADLFRKKKDYTDLLTHMIKVNNDCLKSRSESNKNNIFKIFVDLSNVKLKNADYEFIKMLIPFLEEAYPNNLEKMYFKNTPFIFKTAYSIIRNFIHKETRSKIIFVKKNKMNTINEDIEFSEDKMEEIF